MFVKKGYQPKEVPMYYTGILSQIKFLQGKVLTVIDASYSNEKQLKAVKDLISKMFSEQLTWISQICYPELPMQNREQVKESGINVDEVERGAVDYAGAAPLLE